MKDAKTRLLSHPVQKVVIVQTDFIGDVIFASPLVHAFKEAYPQSQVALLVRPKSRDVAACIPGVDQVLTFDKSGEERGTRGILKLAARLRRERFDLMVAPNRSNRTALLALLSRIPLRVGYRKGLGRIAYHVTYRPRRSESCKLVHDLKLLEKIGIPPISKTLRLRGPRDQQSYLENFFRTQPVAVGHRLAGLCIGSFKPTKRWPAVYFASLVTSLRNLEYSSLLLGGPDEQFIADQIQEVVGSPVLQAVGNTLLESAALLERCQIVVGSDSGLTHMAQALGVPTVLIYGPTDHRIHSFGEKTRVLTAKVKCRPCHRYGPRRCPKSHHDCMRLVSPESVLDAIREIHVLQTPTPRSVKKAEIPAAGATVPSS